MADFEKSPNGGDLYIRRANSSQRISTYEQWGIACTDVPYLPMASVKDLPANDWADESGEDVYYPDDMPIKAYDWEIGLVYVGPYEEAYDKISGFLSFFRQNGEAMTIYSPHTKTGRRGYLSKYSEGDFFVSKSSDGETATVEFKITFHVTDPETNIVLE